MAEQDVPEDVLRSIQEVIELCNQHNVPPKNLDNEEFVPDDLSRAYAGLINIVADHPNISMVKVDREIGKHVDISLNEEAKFYLWDIAVVQKRDIALDTYTKLEDETENGLIEVPATADMNKNGFRYKDHYLIFDSRFYQNFKLVNHLNNLRSSTICLYAPITFNQLGDPETTRQMFLKEHWAGPKTVDRLKSRRAPEFIQKGTASYQDGVMDRTEFYFNVRDGEWHIQIEELLPRTGVRYSPHATFRSQDLRFYTRYVHAILGSDLERCYHLDGALRSYQTKDRFVKRHTKVDLREPNQLKVMSDRHKIFKIESQEGGFTDYQKIIGLFFKHNPHVKEFFDGQSEETREQEERRSRAFRNEFENSRVDGF